MTDRTTKSYAAIFFKQRPDAGIQVAFVAPSSEIEHWARVPEKKTGNIRNFQRARMESHVAEVSSFFANQHNSSPTAVVVGFDPFRAVDRVTLLRDDGSRLDPGSLPEGETTGRVQVTIDADDDPKDRATAIAAIAGRFSKLREAIHAETREITNTAESVLTAIEERYASQPLPADPAVGEETEDSNEDAASDAEIPEDVRVLLAGLSPSEQQIVVGRTTFLAQLYPDRLAELTDSQVMDAYRQAYNELKPGIIIDGQHRVFGTCKLGRIPFLVTALPFATWPELAFQFIVTNRTAKKVQESLLISIVGNSLSKAQRAAIEDRLRDAGIRVGLIEAVMQVHEDEQSPFYNWIAFGLKNEPGFLDAAAMRGKVITPWYERQNPIAELFDHLCTGRKKSDRTDYWKAEQLWFDFFVTFWNAVRERYADTGVWSSELEEPKTKKRPASKLMTATVLMIFQQTVLQNLLDHLKSKQQKETVPISDSLPNAQKLTEIVRNALLPLTPEFFEGWKLSGFDGSQGARDDLAGAIRLVLEGKKTVAGLKKGAKAHRLFRESEKTDS